MVLLNSFIPLDYNYMKKIFLTKLNEKTIDILDGLFYNNEHKNKYANYILKNIIRESKNILDENHFVDMSLNYSYCNHVYKNGKNKGMMCCAKIFIKPNHRKQKFLCSRHCRDYNTNSRIYSIDNPRCGYIRKNGNQCKHKCNKYVNFCYIHNKYENKEEKNESYKKLFFRKLEKRRSLYFLNKYNKYKYKYNNSIIKFNKFFKISNFFKEYNKIHKNIILIKKK